jgi:glycosyltransferase involved in cell wall biosynthesis
MTSFSIAVLIPCYNEAVTIRKVVADFQRELPEAAIYVYDNNSTDETVKVAQAAGAIVRKEKRQGKGFVMASMFEQVEADYYILVDGDDTYEAGAVHQLLQPLFDDEADMTIGSRLTTFEQGAFRRFHVVGNHLIVGMINLIFKTNLTDIFSGYRAFTRYWVQTVATTSGGFDIETELTLQSLYRHLVLKEIPLPYRQRPEDSFSKLHTFTDGTRVLMKIFFMLKAYKPLTFFGSLAILSLGLSFLMGIKPWQEFMAYDRVLGVASEALSAAFLVLAALLLMTGAIIHSINYRILELEALLQRPRKK